MQDSNLTGKSLSISLKVPFLFRDKPYSTLKPGQATISRTYYDKVTTEKPNGDGVLKNFSRFESNYDQTTNKNVKLGDYKVPAKSMNTMVSYELVHNPSLFNTTKLGRDLSRTHTSFTARSKSTTPGGMTLTSQGARVLRHITPAAQWQSTYKKVSNQVAESEWNRSRRPLWSINRQAYSS